MRFSLPFFNYALLPAYFVVLFLVGCTDQRSRESENHDLSNVADVIFFNGEVYTVDINRSWAQAVAVRGNKIIYVGNDSDCLLYTSPSPRDVP